MANGTLKDAQRPCGTPMSIGHAYALLELFRSAEPMTISELAKRLEIDRTNVSRLCGRMEDAGELVRRAHPKDGRARVLTLTATGKRLARSVDESSARHFGDIAQTLGQAADRVVDNLKLLEKAMACQQTEEESCDGTR